MHDFAHTICMCMLQCNVCFISSYMPEQCSLTFWSLDGSFPNHSLWGEVGSLEEFLEGKQQSSGKRKLLARSSQGAYEVLQFQDDVWRSFWFQKVWGGHKCICVFFGTAWVEMQACMTPAMQATNAVGTNVVAIWSRRLWRTGGSQSRTAVEEGRTLSLCWACEKIKATFLSTGLRTKLLWMALGSWICFLSSFPDAFKAVPKKR